MNIHGKKICDNCFSEIKGDCPICGYKRSKYKPVIGTLPVGTTLHGTYVIGQSLGKGGFGVTYKAYDLKNNRVVAIKEYYPNGIAHRDTGKTLVSVTDESQLETFTTGAEKFYEEAKTVSKFNGNPNIVSVYEIFYENDTVYFVMEYLDGCDLKEFINKRGKNLTQEELLYIVNKVTDALVITHSLNVLHRDISPDNIFVLNNGEIKLIDFGAARQVIAEQSKSLSVILKQGFAPLEQYQRKGKQGAWTDIYALGATMYYCLTGNIPDDATERIDNPSIGLAKDFGVDEKLWSIIEKCMKVRIDDRYQTVIELKNDLIALSIKPVPLIYNKAVEIPPTVMMNSASTNLTEKKESSTTKDSEDEIGATVAVSGAITSNEVGETVAVSETDTSKIGETVAVSSEFSNEKNKTIATGMGRLNDKNTENNNSIPSVIEFIKTPKGVITASAILITVIVVIVVIILASSCNLDNGNTNNNGNVSVGKNDNLGNNISGEESLESDITTSTKNNDETTVNSDETTVDDETTTQQSTTKLQQQTTSKVSQTTVKPQEQNTTKQQTTTQQQTTTPSNYVTNQAYSVKLFGEQYNGKYTGDWINGKPNGTGTFISDEIPYSDIQKIAAMYKGKWSNGLPNGNGTSAQAGYGAGSPEDGAYTSINFNNDNWIGYNFATIYVGKFVNGEPSDNYIQYSASDGFMGIPGSWWKYENGNITEGSWNCIYKIQ